MDMELLMEDLMEFLEENEDWTVDVDEQFEEFNAIEYDYNEKVVFITLIEYPFN